MELPTMMQRRGVTLYYARITLPITDMFQHMYEAEVRRMLCDAKV